MPAAYTSLKLIADDDDDDDDDGKPRPAPCNAACQARKRAQELAKKRAEAAKKRAAALAAKKRAEEAARKRAFCRRNPRARQCRRDDDDDDDRRRRLLQVGGDDDRCFNTLLSDRELLAKILSYHVIPAIEPTAAWPRTGTRAVATLSGATLQLKMDDRGDRFEDFEIETPGDDNDDDTEMVLGDLAAGQGLVHIIDEVLIPN
jgi:hypothetical protein